MQVRELILSGKNTSSAPVVVEAEVKPTQDRFTKLETALSDFQNALSDFIDEEVAIKTEQKLKDQKQIYEQKISDLNEVVEKAKGSNWIGSLRQKFQPV